MTDRSKSCLSIIYFASALILPLIGLAGGWVWRDLAFGGEMALIIFGFFLVLAGGVLATVTDPSWLMVMVPFCFGVLYMILPDPIPGGLDDALVMSVMATFTFILWRKKQPQPPVWVVLPLIGVGFYELIGGFIPGPFDEMIIAAIGAGIAMIGGSPSRVATGDGAVAAEVGDEPDVPMLEGVGTTDTGVIDQPDY